MTLRIKNWSKFQHYKHRSPPWIRLYRDLLTDPDWHDLTGDQAKLLVTLWLIASDVSAEGYLPASKELAFRLRIDSKTLAKQLAELSQWLEEDASTPLADCKQVASPERETEAETERETEREDAASAALAPAGKNFAYKGVFVKGLLETDLSEWLKLYSSFTRDSMLAELKRVDEYYGGKGYSGKPPKNWFITTSNWLDRSHKRVMEDRVKAKGRVLPSGRVLSDVEIEAYKGCL